MFVYVVYAIGDNAARQLTKDAQFTLGVFKELHLAEKGRDDYINYINDSLTKADFDIVRLAVHSSETSVELGLSIVNIYATH
tara:strand:- start:302 stop:547 length:246 start_codon:yes stop_codon:yes gene_type:complete